MYNNLANVFVRIIMVLINIKWYLMLLTFNLWLILIKKIIYQLFYIQRYKRTWILKEQEIITIYYRRWMLSALYFNMMYYYIYYVVMLYMLIWHECCDEWLLLA